MATLPLIRAAALNRAQEMLRINAELLTEYLVYVLIEEVIRQRGISRAVLGLSGGVDSAVTAYLCAKAFGPENVIAVRMPYKVSSADSLSDAQAVIDDLGIKSKTLDITAMVDGYADRAGDSVSPGRIGNICARCRMTILFDQAVEFGALPIGTGNKTERMFGYFTWHGDDAPPINPLGDLFKTQVFELARFLGVPESIIAKPPTADLIKGQTDEADFGLSYDVADEILVQLMSRRTPAELVSLGYAPDDVSRVTGLVSATHWKRKLPTVAMTSVTSINDYYLRPVDLRNHF